MAESKMPTVSDLFFLDVCELVTLPGLGKGQEPLPALTTCPGARPPHQLHLPF